GGAIRYGEFREPMPGTYPLIAAAGFPVLLLTAPEEPEFQAAAEAAILRFRSALPDARVVSMPDAVHDLVSYAPAEVARLVGDFSSGAHQRVSRRRRSRWGGRARPGRPAAFPPRAARAPLW